jgi:hypothetical protein
MLEDFFYLPRRCRLTHLIIASAAAGCNYVGVRVALLLQRCQLCPRAEPQRVAVLPQLLDLISEKTLSPRCLSSETLRTGSRAACRRMTDRR